MSDDFIDWPSVAAHYNRERRRSLSQGFATGYETFMPLTWGELTNADRLAYAEACERDHESGRGRGLSTDDR